MKLALEQARVAAQLGDVPVGAVLTLGERILAVGHNRREIDGDPTAHAEIVALRRGATERGHWRLHDASLYVTLEPCAMCAGALVNARLKVLIFGALDPKAGAVGSLMNLCQDARLNHRVAVQQGILQSECSTLLTEFFRQKRAAAKAARRTGAP